MAVRRGERKIKAGLDPRCAACSSVHHAAQTVPPVHAGKTVSCPCSANASFFLPFHNYTQGATIPPQRVLPHKEVQNVHGDE